MRNSVKTILIATVVFAFTSAFALAQNFSAELSAGPDSVTADVQTETPFQGSTICLGGGGIYMEDDLSLLYLNAGLKQSLFDPALTIGVGFKGVIGEVEKTIGDFDVAAIGFSASGEYDFSRVSEVLPFSIYASVTAAPDPMSFKDAKEYREYSTGIDINVIENGAIVARYTHLEFDLKKGFIETEKTQNIFFLGLRFSLGL